MTEQETNPFQIRPCRPDDTRVVEALYRDAFPEEDLVPLVQQLLCLGEDGLSLAAVRDQDIVGHVGFTFCSVADHPDRVVLLAPLAVSPGYQGHGIGILLVRTGFETLRGHGVSWVLVLGDPAYYHRFGFGAEEDIRPPYALPAEWLGAWQSVEILDAEKKPKGGLNVPSLWQSEALWR